MIFQFQIQGPKGYGFTNVAVPEPYRFGSYRVIGAEFVPDGGVYVVDLPDVPRTEIPTGTTTWTLDILDEIPAKQREPACGRL
jgi:hypothetical protein